MKTNFLIIFLFLSIFFSGIPHAQGITHEKSQGIDGLYPPPKQTKNQTENLKGPINPEFFLPPVINTLWDQRQSLINRGDAQGAQAYLIVLQNIKKQQGIENLRFLSQLLLWEAKEALDQGDLSKAGALIDSAIEISPDYPPPYSVLSRKNWSEEPWKIFRNLGNSLTSLAVHIADFRYSLNSLRAILFSFFFSLLIFLFVLAFILLLRSLPKIAHTFWELSGRSISSFNQWGLTGLLSLLPIFFGFPLLLVLLIWVGMAWIFLRKHEKLIMGFLLVFVFTVFYSGNYWEFLYSAEEDEQLQIMADTLNGEWISKQRINEEEIESLPWQTLFSLASIKKREGYCKEAIPIYLKILINLKKSDKAMVLNNLGNCYFYTQQYPKAILTYERSIQEFPSFVTPYYNISQTYREDLQFKKGKVFFQKAREEDEKKVSYFSYLSTLGDQYRVIDETFGRGKIWKQALLPKEGEASTRVWGYFLGALTKQQLFLLLVFWAGVIVIVSVKGRNMRSTGKCHLCLKTICNKCLFHLVDKKTCRECWSKHKNKHVKSLIGLKKKIFKGYQKVFLFLSGVFIPGSAHIYIGKPIKGMIWMVLFGFLILELYVQQNSIFIVGDGINGIQGVGNPIPWLIVILFVVSGLIYDLKKELLN